LSAHCNRHNVVECQIFRGKFFPAILTHIVVPRIDIGARKLHSVEVLDANIFEETDDRRKLDGKCDGMDLLIVLFNYLNFSGEEQGECLFPGNNPEWFVRSVQQKRCSHLKSRFFRLDVNLSSLSTLKPLSLLGFYSSVTML